MNASRWPEWIREASASLRIAAVSLLVLGGLYPALLGGLGRAVVPASAAGSLLKDADGAVVGSLLIAQKFTLPGYFWPRPSAVDFDASAAGGSNLPPGGPDLAARVRTRIASLGGSAANPVPVDLLAASGSGLDPHISLAGAEFQVGRVAAARRLEPGVLRSWLRTWAVARGEGRRRAPLVNVLSLNRALDESFDRPPAAAPAAGRGEGGCPMIGNRADSFLAPDPEVAAGQAQDLPRLLRRGGQDLPDAAGGAPPGGGGDRCRHRLCRAPRPARDRRP